ncbi:antitoxin VbhA family protein [Aeromicrobium sp. 179-A 4D2 NHS]|uniref:antitoxin VbhA family protein n=1 Tax=Aeromicrobium sp. 179-A 4D2 NHS TaxID=3142375 RepID=UPI0039A1149A
MKNESTLEQAALSPEQAVRHAVGSAALEGLTITPEFEATLLAVATGERDVDDAVAEIKAEFAACESS